MHISFTEVLNLSITTSLLVLGIIAIRRVLLKNAPKRFHCALWALVAIRLLIPFSMESTLSLVPSREVIPERYLYMEPVELDTPAQLEIVTNPIYDTPITVDTETTVDRIQQWDLFATVIWYAGMGAMAIYALFSYLSLRLRVRMAGWAGGRIWECDELDSPFILGLFRPRIYLPSHLDAKTRAHVLAHENAHLKRLDHLWKPLGFALLAIHWFNPVMWLGYICLCRDIELACDERVIRDLDRHQVRAYSEALVRCSVTHRSIAACPLAFGEVGVKSRIKAMLHYKKPGFWILLAAVLSVLVLSVCLLTDPPEEPELPVQEEVAAPSGSLESVLNEDGYRITSTVNRSMDLMFYKHWLPEAVLGSGYSFGEGELTLYQSDTTTIDITWAGPDGEDLRFEFCFRYTLPESGTILLPCHVNIKGISYDLMLAPGRTHDYLRDYDSGLRLIHTRGTMTYSLIVDRELYENAEDYLSFGLDNLWETTYVPSGVTIQDRELHVDEYLYRDPKYSIRDSAAYAPTYIIGYDLHLTALEEGSRWPIRRDMGALTPVALTKENFDDRFLPLYRALGCDPEKLRENNSRAWSCREQELDHFVLLQEDGSLFLAVMKDEVLCNFYRLRIGDTVDAAPETVTRSFAMELTGSSFDVPFFSLSSDGTFTFIQSMTSSYLPYGRYVLEEDALVMKTRDGDYQWTFIPDDGGFRFDASRSSPIRYMKGARESTIAPDGTRFRADVSGVRQNPTLEDAIGEAIIAANQTSHDDGMIYGMICVESHEILSQMLACGVSTVDGLERSTEVATVCLRGVYRTFLPDGNDVRPQRNHKFTAKITIALTEDGYTATEYWQSADSVWEAKDVFPDHALELLEQRQEVGWDRLRDDCLFLARRQLYHNLGRVTDIETLLNMICSSPAASSNPGAYIEAHPVEFETMVNLGSLTLNYCFARFAEGNQMDLQGHIMAIACQEILADYNEECTTDGYMTGQAWFNQFVQESEQIRSGMSLTDFEKRHPARHLALGLLGI